MTTDEITTLTTDEITTLTPDAITTYDWGNNPTEYYAGGAIKALKKAGDIGGYLVNWGSPSQRDAAGEWFTPDTEFHLEYYTTRPVLLHHGLGEAGSVKIGEIYDLQKDDRGIYARAKLYLDHPDPQIRYWATEAYNHVKRDKLFWSSGSSGHLLDKTSDGEITKWGLIEGTLTPNPAEKVRTKVDALKFECQQFFGDRTATPKEQPAKEDSVTETKTTDRSFVLPQAMKHRPKGLKMIDNTTIQALLESGLNAEQVLGVIGVLGDAGEAPADDGMMADDNMDDDDEEVMQDDEYRSAEPPVGKSAGSRKAPAPKQDVSTQLLKVQVANLQKELKSIQRAPATETVAGRTSPNRQVKFNHRISNKYDNMSAEDMGFLKTVMDAAMQIQGKGNKWIPQDEVSFYKSLSSKVGDQKIKISEAASRALAIKSGDATKDDELNYSTQASYGDEFVPELWSSNLWRTPRLENPVFANSTVIEMPSNPYRLPIEGSDPTVFAVGETQNETALNLDSGNSPIPDSKIGTVNTTMTAAKLALRVMLAEELNEDSIIPVVQLWREQAVREMEDARDAVILSADASATSANINYDGASATTSVAAVSRFLYGGGDGYLHVPLIEAATQAVNMQNVSPTLTKIREARGKLDRDIFQKRNELVYYCDPETLLKLESLDEAIVTSINGVGSTYEGREVKAIDGIPVFPTAEMGLATSTGVVSATASNNDRGRLLLVHKPSWYVGFRRQMRVTFDYLHQYDAHMLVVTMRMALVKRSSDTVSLLYNIAV
jgi:HK97 family phage major capsid protein